MPKPVTMPFAAILPSGPASNVNGGCHCSGPVTAGVVSGARGAGAGSGEVADTETAVDAPEAAAEVCACAAAVTVKAVATVNVICRMKDEREDISSHQLSPPICKGGRLK